MTLTLNGADGITLAYDEWGDPSHPPLMLLHGGGQTRGSWAGAGPLLAERGWYVMAMDHRGHGESEWSPDQKYANVDFARDLDRAIRRFDEPPVIIGASLGGIAGLVAVGELGSPCKGLVLVDIAHRAEDKGVDRIVDFMYGNPDGFASVEEAAQAVAEYLPHRPPPKDLEGLKRNLREKDGRFFWHWDPGMFDERVPERNRYEMFERNLRAARNIEAPVLLVRGGLSDVLSPEIADEFIAVVPQARLVEVEAAAHMVAGDRNDRFVSSLVPFLDSL